MKVKKADAVTADVVLSVIDSQKASASGASRKVYDLGAFVLKVDRPGTYGTYGLCSDEIGVWEGAPPDLRTFLCPVLAYDESMTWVVMPKCKELGPTTDRDSRRLGRLHRRLQLAGIRDQHCGNIMRYRGHAVSVDYAYQ